MSAQRSTEPSGQTTPKTPAPPVDPTRSAGGEGEPGTPVATTRTPSQSAPSKDSARPNDAHRHKTPREWAEEYLSNGWAVIPLPPRSKICTIEGWPELRLRSEDLPSAFADPNANIGVLLGEPSGGLVDIDLDHPTAVMLADRFLPPTGAIFGRSGKPRSHRLYYVPEGEAVGPIEKFESPKAQSVGPSEKLESPKTRSLVEYRGEGGQTVFPGSYHATTREPIEWEARGEPAVVGAERLRQHVRLLAAATLIYEHWPKQGARNDAYNALAGLFAKEGARQEAVEEFVADLAHHEGDEEARKRVACVRATYRKHADGKNVTGIKRLGEILGTEVAEKVRQWLLASRPGAGPTSPDEAALEAAVEEMNRSLAVAITDHGAAVFHRVVDSDSGLAVWRVGNLEALRVRYGKTFPSHRGGRGLTEFSAWLHHPRRREYGVVDFRPDRPFPEYDLPGGGKALNLWPGFAVEPLIAPLEELEKKCRRFLDHLRDIICARDLDAYRYVLAWLAQLVKEPGVKIGQVLVLRGKMGTGKSLLVKYIEKILGPTCLSLQNQEHATNAFNDHFERALLAFFDEAFFAGSKQAKNYFKGLITEPRIQISAKYQSLRTVSNFTRFIFATNDKWAVPADEDERRYTVLDVSDKRAQDHDYFAAFTKEMNEDGPAALLAYLKQYKYDGINLRKPYRTAALADQKVRNQRGTPLGFWVEVLNKGVIDEKKDSDGKAWFTDTRRNEAPPKTGVFVVPKPVVYKAYCDYSRRNRHGDPVPEAEFGKETGEIFARDKQARDVTTAEERASWGIVGPEARFQNDRKRRYPVEDWVVDEEGNQRRGEVHQPLNAYGLPAVEIMRKAVEAKLGQPVEWAEYDPTIEAEEDRDQREGRAQIDADVAAMVKADQQRALATRARATQSDPWRKERAQR